jgi:uncharacterized membrane protein
MSAPLARLDPTALFKRGYAAFRRQPGICVAAWIIYAMVGGNGGGSGIDFEAAQELGWLGIALIGGGALFGLAVMVIAGPVRGGYDLTMLRLLRGDDSVELGDVFSGFQRFGKLLIVYLIYGFVVFLGILLCVLPGIYMGILLYPSFLVAMESDDPPIDCMKRTYRMTKPYFWQLLGLAIFSLGATVLGLLACCVGLLVAGPVVQLAWMAAYDEMVMAEGDAAPPITVPAENIVMVGGRPVENKPLRP